MRLALALAALLLSACATGRDLRSDEARAGASLELLKQLQGSWVTLDEAGRPTDTLASVIRVTAGGSAVEETVFPGTEHEMVTLYFVRDGALQLTHYCVRGNQPHMLARAARAAGELEFECDGTGVASEDEGHMHSAHLRLTPEGRLETRWQFLEQGKPTHVAEFKLVRKAS